MKRVLTLAVSGLFVTGLALMPLSVRADQTVSPAKDGKAPVTMTHTAAPVVTGTPGGTPSVTVKKPDDKKAVVAPATVKPAAKTAS